ncbi:hypothetical protein AVEN_135632-1 [Araneus ventricosus]|uniref:Uncharacterized protein n=1 Tax=Araneus ventricosus TaxID=182803 RepID=A0A4Y2J346_ARAVE|nr:hypothetical protein AVEN_135632-1 [Araneus ventricosus]
MRISSLLHQCLRCCTSSEPENHCPSSKFFNRVKSQIAQDQENRLVVKVLKCEVLTGNLTSSVSSLLHLFGPNSRVPSTNSSISEKSDHRSGE